MRRKVLDLSFAASATVEASLIFPVIIFAIIAFLWLLFFLYARIKLEADIDLALDKAAEYFAMAGKIDEEEIPEGHIDKYIRNYPYCRVSETRMRIEKDTLFLESNLGLMGPKGGLTGLFIRNMKLTKVGGKIRYYDRAQIKRYLSAVKKTLGDKEDEQDDPD